MGAIEPPVMGPCRDCGAATNVRVIDKCALCMKGTSDWFWSIWDAEEVRRGAPGSDKVPA